MKSIRKKTSSLQQRYRAWTTILGRRLVMSGVLISLLITAHLPTLVSAQTVEVWLTLPDRSKTLNREPNLTFGPGSGSAAYILNLDHNTSYQTIAGIGAALTDSSAWLIANSISATQREALMADLFTRNGAGIGLSYLRIPMGASDFALNSYTYDDLASGTDPDMLQFSIAHDQAYIIPILKQARSLNSELKFMGTPWSPPAWMKTSGILQGGSLHPDDFQAFANYHVKFVQAYGAEGIPIDALTPQNEPGHETSAYPSMAMTAAEQTAFVKNNLGPALTNAGLNTKILILDHNWDMTEYALTVLSDAGARAYVEGTAFHCYRGNVANQSTVYTSYPNKSIWFTECSGTEEYPVFGDNLNWNMHNLVIGNFRNWGSSLLLWNIALDENHGPTNGGCSNCRGVVTINRSPAPAIIAYNVEYYVLGHVSKFVDPGAVRIDSTNFGEGQPENVAFRNPDGSIVLIVHSTAAATFDVRWNGQHITYSLPAGGGTVTFKTILNNFLLWTK